MSRLRVWFLVLIVAAGCGAEPGAGVREQATAPRGTPQADPLPSWNDGATKAAIVDFVGRVSRDGGQEFVAPAERIATFDNDGTLWGEQPIYVQVAFALDRVKALAPKHPEWTQKQPFKGVLEGDVKAVAASGEHGLLEIMAATHAGNTTEEFSRIVAGRISA